MGESMSRSCQACWDPEGTAAIVRKKKAQRNAINTVKDLLDRLEKSPSAEIFRDLKKVERDLQEKNEGKFWAGLQSHPEWPPLYKRVEDAKMQYQ
mmetsp:Transcript_21417/g.62003  ORF Transcript_21417/g.62003 Transcript_21417/m.62003 type:complete len:95 (-) Transcript_21417:168-452(-)